MFCSPCLFATRPAGWPELTPSFAPPPQPPSTNMILAHKVSHVHFEPVGLVCAVVSWNYPLHNLLSPIIAALFAGNAIVVKPSEHVAWSSLHFVRAVRAALVACGHSPELVQVVTCLPDSVEALTGDMRLGHLTFIGSEEVGRKVAIKAAEAGTPAVLELGGKDACVVLDSADVAFFADTWMRAAFQAAGQNCIGVERFVVHAALYQRFVDEMVPRVHALRLGDVMSVPIGAGAKARPRIDVGAMVTDRLFDRLEGLIQEAVRDGARLLIGGKRFTHPDHPQGHYFEPTLLVDVTPTMAIAQQEVFAPVMTVIKVASKEEAVAVASKQTLHSLRLSAKLYALLELIVSLGCGSQMEPTTASARPSLAATRPTCAGSPSGSSVAWSRPTILGASTSTSRSPLAGSRRLATAGSPGARACAGCARLRPSSTIASRAGSRRASRRSWRTRSARGRAPGNL